MEAVIREGDRVREGDKHMPVIVFAEKLLRQRLNESNIGSLYVFKYTTRRCALAFAIASHLSHFA